MFCLLFCIRRNERQMAKLPITDFTYSKVQRLLQEACYDQAIAALSQRIEAQPQDRMARLLLLLANVSRFGTGPFNRQIDELRLFTDLSSNERHIVRQIFLVCFQHAERDGQTIQKIVYQRLIRRLMLNQPLDISISEARSIEQSEEAPSTCIVPAALPWTAAGIDDAGLEVFPRAPRRLDRWDEYALIGAGAMIIIVLLGFYVMTGRRAPLAQNPVQLISLASGDDSETEIIADRTRPVVLLAPTFTAEPARRLLSNQLGGLTNAYARWIEADPNTSGYVSLKLKIEPSGRVAKVEEVLSRLSEHRFLEVIIAEAKLWKLPHGGTTAAEVSVPLIFNPRATSSTQQVAEGQAHEPALVGEELAATHTSFALEEAEAPAAELPTVANNESALKPHTREPLERAADTEIAAAAKGNGDSPGHPAVKRVLAPAPTTAETEAEIARTAALKHEPRFAADAIEKVGLGTRVTVLRKERDWIKVKVNTSGNVGYLRKEYLAAVHSLP
jgi:hypothetical protein